MVNILIKTITLYRQAFASFLSVGGLGGLKTQCRFQPTCSEYSVLVLKEFGFWRGGYLALKRLSSCHPFSHKTY
ncbi:MAG TPA: membrane protein insertion efficiency factor YidD [Candidatus Paceibacterota bacterium]|nr:membrane protein insertion efficiency factor YidD [Candidatus Paceibacterota bacterium]